MKAKVEWRLKEETNPVVGSAADVVAHVLDLDLG